MAKYTVSLRGGFSDRNGIKVENTVIQTTNFDERTRIALSNSTSIILNARYNNFNYSAGDECQTFIKRFWAEVYGQAIEWDKYYDSETLLEAISDSILTDDYDSVLTIIEYIVDVIDNVFPGGFTFQNKYMTATQVYNDDFEREYVGYRLINYHAQAITDDTEIQAIQECIDNKYTDVKQHIKKALGLLSDRQSPDYANSIKESISAVERMCSIIIGKPTTLGDALKKLEDGGVIIHAALKGGFSKLYGYTSDASGIRHAGELGGADSTFEEAKFMLVSCCAFVNYLTGLMAKCN